MSPLTCEDFGAATLKPDMRRSEWRIIDAQTGWIIDTGLEEESDDFYARRIAQLTPSRDELRRLVKKHPAPQEWYYEDEDEERGH
jgi:hypothetical protein